MTDPTAKRLRKPQLGEFLEAEALVNYLKRGHRRGTLTPHCDRITVNNGLGEERFDLVRVEGASVGNERGRGKSDKAFLGLTALA